MWIFAYILQLDTEYKTYHIQLNKMGKQKKNCWNCGQRHCAPAGSKCFRTELSDSASMSSGGNVSGVAGSEADMDFNVIYSTCKSPQASSSRGAHEDIQQQILKQLQRVNQRLDEVEDRVATGQHKDNDEQQGISSKQKLSRSHRHNKKVCVQSDSESESADNEQYIPSLNSMQKSSVIQRQIDSRIRKLEQQSKTADAGGKPKSKRG